jgi:hypothetical protein
VRCNASSCAFVGPAVTAAANRSPTESGVIGAAGVRCARVCRFAEIHSYGSDNPTADAAALPPGAGTTDASTARARCHSAGYSHNIASHAQPVDVCARYGGHRINFMRPLCDVALHLSAASVSESASKSSLVRRGLSPFVGAILRFPATEPRPFGGMAFLG